MKLNKNEIWSKTKKGNNAIKGKKETEKAERRRIVESNNELEIELSSKLSQT
jgi:hypothetical protein